MTQRALSRPARAATAGAVGMLRTHLLGLVLAVCVAGPLSADTVAGRQALADLRALAEQGDAQAQYRLGFVYDRGMGTPPHPDQALKWYRAAAEQGHARAQYELGRIYRKGEYAPRDATEAQRWFRMAAEQEIAGAQYSLAVMLRDGEGAPADVVQAYAWFDVAGAFGHPFAWQSRDALGARLGPDQLEQARGVARRWLEQRGK